MLTMGPRTVYKSYKPMLDFFFINRIKFKYFNEISILNLFFCFMKNSSTDPWRQFNMLAASVMEVELFFIKIKSNVLCFVKIFKVDAIMKKNPNISTKLVY